MEFEEKENSADDTEVLEQTLEVRESKLTIPGKEASTISLECEEGEISADVTKPQNPVVQPQLQYIVSPEVVSNNLDNGQNSQVLTNIDDGNVVSGYSIEGVNDIEELDTSQSSNSIVESESGSFSDGELDEESDDRATEASESDSDQDFVVVDVNNPDTEIDDVDYNHSFKMMEQISLFEVGVGNSFPFSGLVIDEFIIEQRKKKSFTVVDIDSIDKEISELYNLLITIKQKSGLTFDKRDDDYVLQRPEFLSDDLSENEHVKLLQAQHSKKLMEIFDNFFPILKKLFDGCSIYESVISPQEWDVIYEMLKAYPNIVNNTYFKRIICYFKVLYKLLLRYRDGTLSNPGPTRFDMLYNAILLELCEIFDQGNSVYIENIISRIVYCFDVLDHEAKDIAKNFMALMDSYCESTMYMFPGDVERFRSSLNFPMNYALLDDKSRKCRDKSSIHRSFTHNGAINFIFLSDWCSQQYSYSEQDAIDKILNSPDLFTAFQRVGVRNLVRYKVMTGLTQIEIDEMFLYLRRLLHKDFYCTHHILLPAENRGLFVDKFIVDRKNAFAIVANAKAKKIKNIPGMTAAFIKLLTESSEKIKDTDASTVKIHQALKKIIEGEGFTFVTRSNYVLPPPLISTHSVVKPVQPSTVSHSDMLLREKHARLIMEIIDNLVIHGMKILREGCESADFSLKLKRLFKEFLCTKLNGKRLILKVCQNTYVKRLVYFFLLMTLYYVDIENKKKELSNLEEEIERKIEEIIKKKEEDPCFVDDKEYDLRVELGEIKDKITCYDDQLIPVQKDILEICTGNIDYIERLVSRIVYEFSIYDKEAEDVYANILDIVLVLNDMDVSTNTKRLKKALYMKEVGLYEVSISRVWEVDLPMLGKSNVVSVVRGINNFGLTGPIVSALLNFIESKVIESISIVYSDMIMVRLQSDSFNSMVLMDKGTIIHSIKSYLKTLYKMKTLDDGLIPKFMIQEIKKPSKEVKHCSTEQVGQSTVNSK